ncbi:hypothetical protein [Vibrio mediterranei]|uniref:hypothetical protein n=1 Tax=Vibrio mediterranei TaxID=689 RepID=UPI004067FA99
MLKLNEEISDTRIRRLMQEHPPLFRGMHSTHYYYIEIVRNELKLFEEHSTKYRSGDELIRGYVDFKQARLD